MKRTFDSLISISLCLILIVMSCSISLAGSAEKEHSVRYCAHPNRYINIYISVLDHDAERHVCQIITDTVCGTCFGIVEQTQGDAYAEAHSYSITADLGHRYSSHLVERTCTVCRYVTTGTIPCSGPPCASILSSGLTE